MIAEPDHPRHLGEGGTADHRGPDLGQLALREVGEVGVQEVGDHQLEHCVTEELHPLEVGSRGVLARDRAVGQCQLEQSWALEAVPESFLEGRHDARRTARRPGRPRSAPSLAMERALAIATRLEEPWEMTTTPFTPSSWAPPYVS